MNIFKSIFTVILLSYPIAAKDCIGVCVDLKEDFPKLEGGRYSYKFYELTELKNKSHVESAWNNSTIKELNVSGSSVVESSFSSAMVGSATIENTIFSENKLSYSNYASASFKNVNLEESELNNTRFGKVSFGRGSITYPLSIKSNLFLLYSAPTISNS